MNTPTKKLSLRTRLLIWSSNKTIAIIIILTCLTGTLTLWNAYNLRQTLILSSSIGYAQSYSRAISAFDSLYATSIYNAPRSAGASMVPRSAGQPSKLPSPDQFARMLAEELSLLPSGIRVNHYPADVLSVITPETVTQPTFVSDAWSYLTANPGETYHRIHSESGEPALRFAFLESIEIPCPDCAADRVPGSQPTGTPTRQENMLEIILPMENAILATEDELSGTYWLVGLLFLSATVCILLAIIKVRNIESSLNSKTEELRDLNQKLNKKAQNRTIALKKAIVQRKSAESESKDSHTRYMAAIELMHDAHIIIDSDGLIQSFNKAAESSFGYAREEVLGRNIKILMTRPIRDLHDEYLDRYASTGEAYILGNKRETGMMGRRKDGTTFPISLIVEKFETDEGTYFSGILRDITHQQEIESRNKRLNAVVEQATDCIVIMNVNREIEYVNAQFELEYGYDLPAVSGMKSEDFPWNASPPDIYEEQFETVGRGEVWSGHLLSRSRDGNKIEHDVICSPISNETGEISHFVQIQRNVTERLQLERQLQQAQKLESIGQLAAGIAHEINTPSQYVGDNTRFLRDVFDDLGKLVTRLEVMAESNDSSVPSSLIQQALKEADIDYLMDEIPKAIDQSLEGIERVTRIVRAMKEFSHPEQDKSLVDLNRAIESTITVATNEWKYVAELKRDLAPDLPMVPCIPGEINQVILNILVNAAHAINEKQTGSTSSKGLITVSTCRNGSWAEIRITDSGCGIPEDIQQKIFDPFFTTKEVGKGTGQGLCLAHAVIVEKHTGTIGVESTPGQGTCFTIRLPLEEDAAPRRKVAA